MATATIRPLLGGLHRRMLVDFIEAKGFTVQDDIRGAVMSKNNIQVEADHEKLVLLLTELRHEFPTAYADGWVVP